MLIYRGQHHAAGGALLVYISVTWRLVALLHVRVHHQFLAAGVRMGANGHFDIGANSSCFEGLQDLE